jgi:CubicO group peptidase (beta-lactamase class C family)
LQTESLTHLISEVEATHLKHHPLKKLLTFCFLFFSLTLKSQSLYFPPVIGNNWDTVSPVSLGWCPDKIDTLIDYLGNTGTKAFILLQDGKIAIEHYFGTFTVDSAWYWASAGKSLTSFTVGIAQQEGFLNINDTSSKYMGAGWTICPQAKEDLITVRNQLTMTTGLNDLVPDNTCTLDSCLEYLADAGTRWAYHNAPYTLLDSVIETATGQTLNSYVIQKVCIPTGMTGAYIHTGYDNVFFSKPRSMARYGLLILNHGNWNGNQIMTDTNYFNAMVNTSQALNPSYGYLWWLNGKSSFMVPQVQISFPGELFPSAPADAVCALGKNGQLINVVPSRNLVFIRMGDNPGGLGPVSLTYNDSVWMKLNDVFCNANSIVENDQLQQLNIYPNPATDLFTVDFTEKNYDLTIVDAMGRVVYEQKNISGRNEISSVNFSEGVYFVRVKTDKRVLSEKIIIQ